MRKPLRGLLFVEHLIILDTETASLSGGVVDLAWLHVTPELEVISEFRSLCNPERPIENEAQAIHGITEEAVANAPTLAQLVEKIPQPFTLIAHNAAFDRRMITPAITPARSLCTLELSRQYIKGVSRHKLEVLQKELLLPVQKSHTALGDVHTVRDLLEKILPIAQLSIEELIVRQQHPRFIQVMPWGKHEGTPILRVPASYRNWLLDQADLDPNLRFTLEKVRGL